MVVQEIHKKLYPYADQMTNLNKLKSMRGQDNEDRFEADSADNSILNSPSKREVAHYF